VSSFPSVVSFSRCLFSWFARFFCAVSGVPFSDLLCVFCFCGCRLVCFLSALPVCLLRAVEGGGGQFCIFV